MIPLAAPGASRESASMNSISLHILLVVAAAALGHVKPAQAENYFCQQQFALCTSAPCIPEPGNPKIAMCTCDVARPATLWLERRQYRKEADGGETGC